MKKRNFLFTIISLSILLLTNCGGSSILKNDLINTDFTFDLNGQAKSYIRFENETEYIVDLGSNTIYWHDKGTYEINGETIYLHPASCRDYQSGSDCNKSMGEAEATFTGTGESKKLIVKSLNNKNLLSTGENNDYIEYSLSAHEDEVINGQEATEYEEGTMTTNVDMILGRWVSQTVKGFEVEFKDGQRIEFQDGVEGGWMPYSVVESCENQTDDAMGSALSIKYVCYKLDFVSSDEFTVEQQSPKKGEKEVYKRKK